MAAYVCSHCEVHLPVGDHENRTCPGCGEKTTYNIAHTPHADWETRVARSSSRSSDDDKVTDWRLLQLLQAGLDYETANELATMRRPDGTTVDVGRFHELVERGATPAQAARILG